MRASTVTFEGFEFTPRQRRLVRDGRSIRIGSRAFDILATLIANAGAVVSKEQLMLAVWPSTFVDDATLRVHMSALRRALEGASAGARTIENIPGRGYCFVALVVAVDREQAEDSNHQSGSVASQSGHDQFA